LRFVAAPFVEFRLPTDDFAFEDIADTQSSSHVPSAPVSGIPSAILRHRRRFQDQARAYPAQPRFVHLWELASAPPRELLCWHRTPATSEASVPSHGGRQGHSEFSGSAAHSGGAPPRIRTASAG